MDQATFTDVISTAESEEENSSGIVESAGVIKNQLVVTRNEISNLRQQVKNLRFAHKKELDNILNVIKDVTKESPTESTTEPDLPLSPSDDIPLKCIGVISTCFPRKRAIPRQPGICINSSAKLTLNNSVFTNPKHALEGLEEFSHMWIIFHFHKNESTHVRAKVAPPRLNGIRTGVFSTRSPHRPSPIGLSLVRIDKIEEASIYFSGVDMLDGTPVIDIKPYIPDYDDPINLTKDSTTELCTMVTDNFTQVDALPVNGAVDVRLIPREAPDGEETGCPSGVQPSNIDPIVRVPAWISNPAVVKLTVEFDDRAKISLDNIRSKKTAGDPEEIITKVLQEDPRSKYLRERYANQFYTFEIDSFQVSVKFDDVRHSVLVYRINESSCQSCNEPVWKCLGNCTQ